MEHEDNAQLENYLQNSQNRMETLHHHASSGVGFGVGVGIAGECVGDNDAGEIVGAGNIGQKYGGEHDDEEELKYIKEVQQSEKQQQQQQQQLQQQELFGDDSPYSLLGGGDAGDALLCSSKIEGNGLDNFVVANGGNSGVVGSVGGFDIGFGSNSNYNNMDDLYLHGNGIGQSSALDSGSVTAEHGGHYTEDDMQKHDGDFSTNSNTTTSTGEALEADLVAAGAALVDNVLQVEMKIEQQLQTEHEQQQPQQPEEEEEPSSVATTYGTSSLSENPTPLEQEDESVPVAAVVAQQLQEATQAQQAPQEFKFGGFDNKENADPADIENNAVNFGVDLHSELNPNAVEFVPSFGSQPTSPTEESAPVFGTPRPPSVARHFLGEDDLVAESPRKGRVANMDAILLPAENEFEDEADKRPHGVEQDDDLFGGKPHSENHFKDQPNKLLFENGNGTEDCLDFQRPSSASFIDHGPETSVDNDAMAVLGDEDIMNKSIYVEETAATPAAAIEDILNSVQVLPDDSDSHNNSFIELDPENRRPDDLILEAAADKELLNVEEKELVSHSPSTEELQMNMQNDAHGSNKNIPQLPIDPLDSAANMQESFYMEHTSADVQSLQNDLPSFGDQSLLVDSSLPQDLNASLLNDDDDDMTANDAAYNEAPPQDSTFSPFSSTEEKHLVEDTKEAQQSQPIDDVHEITERLDELLLSEPHDFVGALPQAEQAAHFAATNDNNFEQFNPFANETQPLAADEATLPAYEAAEQQHLQQSAAVDYFAQEEEQQKQQQAQDQLYDNEEVFVEQQQQQQQEQQQQQQQQQLPIEFDDVPIDEAEQPAAHVAAAAAADDLLHDNITESNNFSFDDGKPPAINIDLVEEAAPPAEPLVTEETLAPVETAPAVPAAAAAEATPAIETTPVEDEAPLADAAVAATTVAAATAAAAVVAAAATKVAAPPKTKSTEAAAKKPIGAKAGSVGAKPKVGASSASSSTLAATKKPAAEPIKKSPVSAASGGAARTTASAAARPRTAPTATASKAGATTAAAAAAAAARKPLSSNPAAKTTASRLTTRPATAPTAGAAKPATATRTSTSATAARLTAAGTAATTARKAAATANGTATAAAKARSTAAGAGAATKPTALLGVSSGTAGVAKPKLSSPRATLSSQLRKTAPGAASAAGSGAKSPIKAATAANGGLTKTTSSTLTSRTKAAGGSTNATTSTTTTTTTTIKTFTARPAPKTTHSSVSSTLSTTRRLVAGTAAATAGTAAARKLSPLKPSSIHNNTNTNGTTNNSKSPTNKSSPSPLKAKAKEPVKSPNNSALKSKAAAKQPAAAAGGGAKVANGGVGAAVKALPETAPGQAEQPPTVVNGNGIHNEPAASHDDELSPLSPSALGAEHAQPATNVSVLDF